MFGLKSTILGLAVALASTVFADGEQKFASIGDLKLESGATLEACRVGYRTFGTLNAAKDNVVLMPTWFLGTSGDLGGMIGPGRLVDSRKNYVIAVDALSNGVSTSPSNSPTQHDAAFPTITVRDMVASQHKMLLDLGIHHLYAVMGISMGGIQTFQWVTAYPDFVDKAIPIVGSPRPTSYDLMLHTSGLKAVREAISDKAARSDLIRAFADFFLLTLNTPTYYVQHVKREDAVASMAGFESGLLAWDPYDIEAGLSALIANDAFKAFGDNEAQAGAAVRAKLLVISASQDHCVNPAPALEFAKLLNAATIILTDDAGHSSPGAEMSRISAAVDQFLSRPN